MKLKGFLPNLITLIGLFSSCFVFGQDNNMDSLEQVAASDIHDTLKIPVLIRLAYTYNRKNIDKSIVYAEQLLNISQELEDDLNTAIAYNLLGMDYQDKDYGLDTIIMTLRKGMVFATKVNNLRARAIISNTMALTYEKFGQKDKALSLYQQAFNLSEEMGFKAGSVRCLGNIGALLNDYGDMEAAKMYYQRAIDYAIRLDDEIMASQLGHNLANIYEEENRLDSALILYEKSVDVNRAANEEYFLALSLASIGSINIKNKQYELAYSHLIEAYEIAKRTENTYCVGMTLSSLCSYYANQKKYTEVIRTANEALEVLGENGDIVIRTEFYKHLSDSYEAEKNYPLAFENQRLYHTFSDSIYNIEKVSQINSLKIEHEVAQKETENKLLKAEKDVSIKTIRNRNFIAIGLILALLVAIGFAMLIYRSSQERKKLNEVLEAKVAERTAALQKVNEDLEQANYELRAFNFISSHDIKEPIRNIGNYAGLIFKKLSNDDRSSLGSYFDFIKQSTTQLYTLIEDFAEYTSMSKTKEVQLQPVDLNDLVEGLELSLQSTITQYNGKVINNGLPIIQSNSSLLYISLKNLIENGLKFNQSTQPTVNISYEETDTHHNIIVSDNGIGIEKAYQKKIFEMFKRLHHRGEYPGSGVGLAIVELVMKKIGSQVEVESELNKGSRFILKISK